MGHLRRLAMSSRITKARCSSTSSMPNLTNWSGRLQRRPMLTKVSIRKNGMLGSTASCTPCWHTFHLSEGMMVLRSPLLVLLCVVAACAPAPKVGYDFDRSADFTGYHSYAWLSGDQEKTGDRRADSSAVDMRIRIAVATQLRLKGYQAQPDGCL